MTVDCLVERAPAKINLALHVRARRLDGYHELETIFVFAQDGDEVRVAPGAQALTITGPFAAGLDAGPDNLVNRAQAAFCDAFGVPVAHAITLDKRLPVASGIGGGSADAAATLRALARLNGVSRNDPRLFAVAAALGSDVPACLLGTASFGRGRGESLTSIPSLGHVPALLVNPGVGVSTAAVFKAWDGVDRGAIDPDCVMACRNDLQPPAERLAPVIGEVLGALAAQPGTNLVRMSGSGATCFALFETRAARDAADTAIASGHPDWWRLATTID